MPHPDPAIETHSARNPDSECRQQGLDRASDGEDHIAESRSEFLGLVAETIVTLVARGIAAQELEPLFRLQDALRGLTPSSLDMPADRRRGLPASEILLGRACAIIDLFIFAGASPDEAAQAVTRQLTAAGVRFPEEGGDARAWKRLLNYRTRLLHGSKHQLIEVREAYIELKNKLSDIPADRRIQLALEQYLWDRR